MEIHCLPHNYTKIKRGIYYLSYLVWTQEIFKLTNFLSDYLRLLE